MRLEKEYPYVVTIDQLDDVDIDFARLRNRAALNRFRVAASSTKAVAVARTSGRLMAMRD